MRSIQLTIIKYQDFNKLIHDLGVKGYRCVLDNDWNNDSAHLFENVCAEDLEEEFRTELEDEIADGGKIWDIEGSDGTGYGTMNFNAGAWLELLVEKGVLRPGNYLIHVYW